MPLAMSEMAVERAMTAMAAAASRPARSPFFLGAGAYRRHIPATRRSSHPALGIPDQLHALSAGNRPGHAAGPVRVPDPGRRPDRHGGRQRLDVRRLDRLRRSDADGPSPDAGAARRSSPAACIRNMPTSARRSRIWRATRSSACRPTSTASEDIAAAIDDETSCVIVQTPDFFGNPRDLAPDRRRRARARRAADRRLHRSGVARRLALARRDGRRHRGRRRPGDRQRAQFRRPLCRPVRDAAEERAPDAGTSRRRDGRRRRAGAASC